MTIDEIVENLTEIVSKREAKVKHKEKPVIYLNEDNLKAIEAVRDKLIPITPDDVFLDFYDGTTFIGWCPICDTPVAQYDRICPKCYQRLDWTEGKV